MDQMEKVISYPAPSGDGTSDLATARCSSENESKSSGPKKHRSHTGADKENSSDQINEEKT